MFASLALIGVVATLTATGAAAQARPNVVLIVADDLGWNDVGYHGGEVATPHIDSLAHRGVVLDRFYAFPTCTPTRAALMTGRSPLVLGFHGPMAPEDDGLPEDEQLLPQILRDAGYQTFLVGKWHLGTRRLRDRPTRRGFDHFYGLLNGGIGYWDKVSYGGYDWQRNGVSVREDGYATDLLAEEAVRVLEKRDPERPVFLELAFNAPHVPHEAPEDVVARQRSGLDPMRRVHVAMVEVMDAAIGRVLAALVRESMSEDTIVLFISDNGGAVRESYRAWLRWVVPALDLAASDNTPLRGGKRDVFEGGIRVPALVLWPGGLEGGREVSARVTVQDILPTLAEAIGLPFDPAKPIHGTSRWDAIAHGASAPAPDFIVGNMGSVAYFRGPWKLVRSEAPVPFGTPGAGTHLFAIEDDPSEERDLSAEHPEVVAELEAALEAFPIAETTFQMPNPWSLDDLFGGAETREPWPESSGLD